MKGILDNYIKIVTKKVDFPAIPAGTIKRTIFSSKPSQSSHSSQCGNPERSSKQLANSLLASLIFSLSVSPSSVAIV